MQGRSSKKAWKCAYVIYELSQSVNVVEVKAFKNSVQGILSTTFVVDVNFEVRNENGEKGK